MAPPAPEQPAQVEVPVIVDQPVSVSDEPSPEDIPPADHSQDEAKPPKRRVGLGMW